MASILAKQIFAKDISEALWASNPFLMACKDDTAFVDNDKVNLPHAGTSPGVVKNRTTKGTASKRADSASQYPLFELSTDPTWIQFSEELVVNYNKRASVLADHKNALIDALADNVVNNWAAGGDSEGSSVPAQVRTTGTSRAVGVTQVGATAPTGNRKGIAYVDCLGVVKEFNKQNIPQQGRYGMITADMLSDLLQIAEFKSSDYVNKKAIVDAPETFYWLGINWFVRSKVNVFSNAATPVLAAVGADTATTSNAGAIFWHKDFVRAAKGGVKTFLKLGDPELYGDALSAACRAGAIGARNDNKGIINLVEAAGA